MKNPNFKRTAKILQDDNSKDALHIGILGCGRLGSQIAHCLLTYGKVDAKELHISTRRPETLGMKIHTSIYSYLYWTLYS